MTRRSRPLRGMTLLEISVVTAMGIALAAAGGSTLAEQARRARATDAATNSMLPHTVSRDRAVAARTCVESVLVPALSQAMAMSADLPAVVLAGRRANPRIAVIQWSDCGPDAAVGSVDFYDLDGQIDFTAYSGDGRLVFGIDGGLTEERPGMPPAGGSVTVCGKGGTGTGKGGPTPLPDAGGGGGGAVCKPPGPQKQPSPDVTFVATTYFGDARTYKVYARLGSTEAVTP